MSPLGVLRKRALAQTHSDENQLQPSRPIHAQDTTPSKNKGSSSARSLLNWISILVHVLAVITFVYGFILRSSFHNGEECEMTYSMRNYVQLSMDQWRTYRLYKFVDSRDPRGSQLLKAAHPILDNSHCTQKPFIALYIPGHWGHYTQCRSVGAHGTQWTGQRYSPMETNTMRRALLEGTWNGEAQDIESFVYDVYCVDFAEQGAAVHGNFIKKQAEFVADVVRKLTDECNAPTVTLVAHSIGGLVAKATPALFPDLSSKIRNIITLATPHSNLPYGLDSSMQRVYETVDNLDSSILIISISGGLKDELIPPESCAVEEGISRLAGTMFGMDHKAIVWCHQVLAKVRKILFILARDVSDGRRNDIENIGVVNGIYSTHVHEQKTRYTKANGLVSWVALESAMIYNLEPLLPTYAFLCGTVLAVPTIQPLIASGIVLTLSITFHNRQIPIPVMIVQTLVANCIFIGVNTARRILPLNNVHRPAPLRVAGKVALLTVFAQFCLLFALRLIARLSLGRNTGEVPYNQMLLLSMALWIIVGALTLHTTNQRSCTLSSMLVVTLPCLLFGKIVLYGWNIFDNFGDVDFDFIVYILLPLSLSVFFHGTAKAKEAKETLPSIVATHTVLMIFFARDVFRIGNSYLTGNYVAAVALLEAVRLWQHNG